MSGLYNTQWAKKGFSFLPLQLHLSQTWQWHFLLLPLHDLLATNGSVHGTNATHLSLYSNQQRAVFIVSLADDDRPVPVVDACCAFLVWYWQDVDDNTQKAYLFYNNYGMDSSLHASLSQHNKAPGTSTKDPVLDVNPCTKVRMVLWYDSVTYLMVIIMQQNVSDHGLLLLWMLRWLFMFGMQVTSGWDGL